MANVIGNYTNLEATYQVNFCGAGQGPVEGWNNLPCPVSAAEDTLPGLVDTYGCVSPLRITKKSDDKAWKWGSIRQDGHCEIEGVPEAVYKPQLALGYGNTLSGGVRSRIALSGLDPGRRYTVRAYAGSTYGDDVSLVMRVGDVSTPPLRVKGNRTDTLAIEDVAPVGGGIDIDFVNPVETVSASPMVGFMVIEEYRSGDSPGNTGVWLREARVLEDGGDGVVRFPDVTVHLGCVGAATGYRVGEVETLDGVAWSTLPGDTMDVPYTLSAGFGAKTLYAQVRNLYGESNVRTVDVEYRDPYVPLNLRNVYINDDDAVTYSCDVRLLADKEGIPTHHWVSEEGDPSPGPWVPFPSLAAFAVPGLGVRTVYAQVGIDGTLVSGVRSSSIEVVHGPPVPAARKVAVSLSWERNGYDPSVRANKVSAPNSRGARPSSGTTARRRAYSPR